MPILFPTKDAITGGHWVRSLILREVIIVVLTLIASSLWQYALPHRHWMEALRSWIIGVSVAMTIGEGVMLYWINKWSK